MLVTSWFAIWLTLTRRDILSKFQRKTTGSQFAPRVVPVSTSTKKLCRKIKVLHRLRYYLWKQVFENCRKFSEDNLNPKTIIDKTTESIALGDPPLFSRGWGSRISQVDGTFGAQVQSPQLLLYFPCLPCMLWSPHAVSVRLITK